MPTSTTTHQTPSGGNHRARTAVPEARTPGEEVETRSPATPSRPAVNRRALAKGVAWTLPAITLAAAAPALAASPTPTQLGGFADKCPGASDVPGGWPKHGYRLVLTGSESAPHVVEVVLGNGKRAEILAGPTRVPRGWQWVFDAGSSPAHLYVLATVNGESHTAKVKASPHCTDRSKS